MTLLAGTARLDITPPLGTPMVGYWYHRPASGVLDPLYARALVLSLEDSTVAIVTVDVSLLPGAWVDGCAELAKERSGIPRDHLFVTSSHTHTAPVTERLLTREEPSPHFREFLIHRLADVIELARQNQASARLAVGESELPGLAFNRRLLGPDGKVVTFKPDTYARSMQPAGPVDHHVRVLHLVNDHTGHPLATLVNFALHPDTTGGTLISADYPGVLSITLRHMLGGSPEVLFANGPCGDINHLDAQNPREPYCRDNALRIGQLLAAEAYKITRDPMWLDVETLRAGREPVTLHMRTPSQDQVDAARDIVATHTGEPTKTLLRAQGLLQASSRAGEAFTAEVSAIRLGDVALVGMPGEIFTGLGLQLRTNSPFPHTVIAELTNHYAGYVPTSEAFEQGGYELKLGHGSFVEKSSGEILVNAGLRLLSRLQSE